MNMFEMSQMVKNVQDLTAKIDPIMFAIAVLISLFASLLAGWMYSRFYE